MTGERLPGLWVEGGVQGDAEARAAELLRRALSGGEAPEADEAAAARVRRGLERELLRRASSPPRGMPRPWAVALTTAAAAAAAVLVWLPLRGDHTGRVLEGTVLLVDGGVSRPLLAGEVPAPGTRLGCADRCRIEITSGIEAVLVADTELSIAGRDRVEVHAGGAAFSVDPLPPGERFFVTTGATKVEVIGTAFLVEAAGASPARVSVTHGTVQVSHGSIVRYVHAGEAWVAPAASLGGAGPVAVPTAEPVIEPTAVPVAATPPAAPSASSPPAGAGQPAAAAPRIHRPEPTFGEFAQLIERAATLIGKGQLAEARAVYAGLAERQGNAGELGLYLMAQLELHQLDSAKDAERTLAELRRRYPTGSLTLERDLTAMEVMIAQGRCADARAAIAAFRADYPASVAMLADVESALINGGCGG